MLRIGSKVKILGNNNKGIILDINQNSANVLINNHISAYDQLGALAPKLTTLPRIK